jgi:hypothetical protein
MATAFWKNEGIGGNRWKIQEAIWRLNEKPFS